jgi:hypothetical protein
MTSFVSEIANGLHPQSSRYKAVAVLYAYLDESGTHADSPLVMIGGFVARQPLWAALEPDWQERLDNQGVPYFHASHCEAGGGIFSDVPEPRRNALFAGLAEVIAEHKPVGISVAVRREIWDTLHPDWKKHFPDPYHLCFEFCMQQLAKWTVIENDGEPISLMFAKHQRYEGAARQLYSYYQGNERWSERVVSLAFGEPQKIVALQTADLIVYKKYKRELDRRSNPAAPYRAALDIMGNADVQLIEIDHDAEITRGMISDALTSFQQ